ncbi:MAG: hypothetical protein IJX05_04665 [Clostridia bacterium]|nr:hypothetical protein [Clostridia bacterium]
MNEEQNNVNVENEEKVLWQFAVSRARKLFYMMRVLIILPIILIVIGLMLLLSGNIKVPAFMIIFIGIPVFATLLSAIAIYIQKITVFTITDKKIYVQHPKVLFYAEFADIMDIRVTHSLFNKKIGNINFALIDGHNSYYKFFMIDFPDSVYNLLVSLCKGEDPTKVFSS